MPGAQPRRAPVSRTLSTARRGANVPAGVPGVYRVPRRQVVTSQAADRGAPTASNPWIQPEQTTEFAGATGAWLVGGQTGTVDATDEAAVEAAQSAKYASLAGGSYGVTGSASSGAILQCTDQGSQGVTFRATINQLGLAFDCNSVLESMFEPDLGDYPPGATGVEYENTTGVIDLAAFQGNWQMLATSDNYSPDDATHPLYSGAIMSRMDSSSYDGSGLPIWQDGAVCISNQLAELGTTTDPAPNGPVEFLSQDVGLPDENGFISVFFNLTLVAEQRPIYQQSSVRAKITDASGSSVTFSLYCLYTPPRYRFV